MEKIQNYTILETLGKTDAVIVYHARRGDEDKSYIIKKFNKKGSSQLDTARFRQEYEIIKSIDNEGIIKVFDCIDLDEEIALVLEYFDGITLKSVINSATLTLKTFLWMAIKLTETLGHLHLKNIVHKDITPYNILVNLEKDLIKISDFGIAQVITHENEEIYNPTVIEETLVYMSPEQTGRMNRFVDYRSDLYSLGVTFYEMLTGAVPFKSKDPMELIHAHIAQRPASPRERNQSIPDVISDIIMKLLAKNAEECYQNAFGLMADLEECRWHYEKTGAIEPFEIATRDVSIKFNIPQKFFGRKNEIDIIITAFERVSGTGECEMLLVSGNPGIGKSALVNEIHRPIVAKRGYFISGKHDQFRKDVPYSAFLQAFAGLARQLLTENQERINAWKDALLKELGPNGRVITDIIPAIELIIGKQPDLPVLGPDETNNRFILVFNNFVRVFASKEHPFVIFLDDLQWADLASMTLIKNIMTDPETRHIFFIGSYRDNEVNVAHPLMLTLEEIQKESVAVITIALAPLDVADVNHLISNFLRSDENVTLPLAELIHQKTNGNPFFINQFLKTLYDLKILFLTPVEQLRRTAGNRSGWTWDMEKISAMNVTDNVVELMVESILKFSADAQDILKIAACVGNWFDLETVSLIQHRSIDATLSDLMTVINEGLIVAQGQTYTFYHDRIQEAVYSLIPSGKRAEMHNRIGKLMLKKISEEDLHEKILYIVNQLNLGMSYISTEDERYDLAKLNLRAGIKAKASAAYRSALHYVKTGIELIQQPSIGNGGAREKVENTCWGKWYDVSLSLYSEAAVAAYLCAEYDVMDTYADIVLANARDIFDKANVFETQIRKFMAQNRLLDAVSIGLDALKFLNIRFPQKPAKLHLVFGFMKTKLALLGKSVDDIYNLPAMKDQKILLAMRLLNSIGSAVYWGKPELVPFIIFKFVSLSLKYGNCTYSPYSYATFGLMLCSIGEIEKGYAFGKMSQRLIEKLDARDQKSRVGFVYADFVLHWKKHARETLILCVEGYKVGLETGDLEFAVLNIMVYCINGYYVGKELAGNERETAMYSSIAESLKQKTQLHLFKLYQQIMVNLQSESTDACVLKGPLYDEEIMLPQHILANDHVASIVFQWNKFILYYMFREYHKALASCEICEKNIEALIGQINVVIFYFYDSLVCLALYDGASLSERNRYLRKALDNAKKLKKWADHAPMNHLHKHELVQAEIFRVQGQDMRAMEFYQKAITNAHENEYLNEEAIACERAALFYLKRGYDTIGRAYVNESYRAYTRWGAKAKLRDLEYRHPDLISKPSKEKSDIGTDTASSGGTSSILDISTVIKASQAVSSEIDLGKLVKNIMAFSIQNAGAEKGFLIMENEDTHTLTIEAAGSIDKTVETIGGQPLEEAGGLSIAIVNYVRSTKEDLLLGNACEEGMFTNDEYIRQNRTKSVLCTPIIHKGKLAGILYLENNITTNAFTRDRLELLHILSSQVAISLENAKLFKMAITDGLTELITHKHFMYMLEKEIAQSKRYKNVFSLIMFDIDHFKKFNDNYGHQAGDRVLITISKIAKESLRLSDIIARYGGEEFAVILPETGIKDALFVAEKLREEVEKTELPYNNELLKVTISLGVAVFPDNAKDAETLIKATDDVLYLSKKTGRNKVTSQSGV